MLTRSIRALTALVTVWCLGCSAFDVLLDRLAGTAGAAGMVCASARGEMPSATVAPGAEGVQSVASAPHDNGERAGISCGCQECRASAVTASAVAITIAARHAPRRG